MEISEREINFTCYGQTKNVVQQILALSLIGLVYKLSNQNAENCKFLITWLVAEIWLAHRMGW